MSEKSVNKRIRKILEQDLAEAIATCLRQEAALKNTQVVGQIIGPSLEDLQKEAEIKAQTLGRFEASVRRSLPPPRDLPAPPKWGDG